MPTIPLVLALAAALSAPLRPPSQAQNSMISNSRVTIYVSKLGDDSDGSSWANAFTTIQAALDAVPDDRGGCRIVIRPDTYIEAKLYPAHKGAAGAYNELVGDTDGSLGSGTSGRVIIDSGRPRAEGVQELRLVGDRPVLFQGLVAGAHRGDVLGHRLGPLAVAEPLCDRRRRRHLL